MNHRKTVLLAAAALSLAAAGAPAPLDARRIARIDAFAAEGDRALADRLYMYWNSRATDVFVRDEKVTGIGGARAPAPTLMLSGERSHVTAYERPKIEELARRDEREGGLVLARKSDGKRELAPYGATGGIVASVNREIVSLARDAARLFAETGDEKYARLAGETLDTFLLGVLYRNVPTDLNRGHLQTLFGMQTMETIHDDVIHEATELYGLMRPYVEKRAPESLAAYKAALRKWADVQIENGVADNNWDMMQLNYILDIALVLDEPDRSHYIDVCFNRSSVRNLSIRDLAAKGFDPAAGTWFECPGYSVLVTLKDFARFADRARDELGVDLVAEIPVLQTAFDAAGEYIFPDGMLIGFGDTHPAPIPKEVLKHARGLHTSPFFWSPNASWLVARSGMDATNDVAFAINGSLGNHQHANGISLELYARGYRLAPDAGVGWSLYSGDDYKEYYSQFPAHNTVMVNSRSTYQVMKSHHPLRLVAHGANWATVAFREPETGADQERTVKYVKDAKGAYFVDVFRSRAAGGEPEWHDYYYHNFGDTLEFNGATRPTDEIAFVESGLYCLSYIKDKEAREGEGDLEAVFRWARPEGPVDTRVFINGGRDRTFIKAFAPATEGLSRVKSPDYGVTRDSRTPVIVVRQRGEAWSRPFAMVMDPTGTVKSVQFADGEIRVTRRDGSVDVHNM